MGYSVQLRGADTVGIGAAGGFPNGIGVGLDGAASAGGSLVGEFVGLWVAVGNLTSVVALGAFIDFEVAVGCFVVGVSDSAGLGVSVVV
jgi:hypothetical protein